jgi:hypothetical protein
MHDRSIDRMTNGKGPVESVTFADIRKLDLGAAFQTHFLAQRTFSVAPPERFSRIEPLSTFW